MSTNGGPEKEREESVKLWTKRKLKFRRLLGVTGEICDPSFKTLINAVVRIAFRWTTRCMMGIIPERPLPKSCGSGAAVCRPLG